MISVSGVRGIVGEAFTPEIVGRFSAAFAAFTGKGTVVVGSDTRTSNYMFKYAAFSGLLSGGCEVIDVGVCPTPSVQLMVEKLKADGGIVITGSHNPAEWNALKFIRSDGLFLYPEEGKILLKIYNKGKMERVKWDKIRKVRKDNTAIENHLDKVLQTIDREKIKSKKFKVALDACNGAGALISPELLRRLGCEVIELNFRPDGIFAHPPEPIASNLTQLSQLVKSQKADIGFAHDADADRVAIVTEKGRILPEDYSLLLATKFTLISKKGLVVTNLSTTRALDEVAEQFNCPIKRTKIGDIHVSRCMKEEKAVIGGEGNGGVILPQIHYARDGIAAIVLLLEYLAETSESISKLASNLPNYYIVKRKLKANRVDFSLLKTRLKKEFKGAKFNFLDGIKVDLNKSWIHIRHSGTEPVIRIITEAKTKREAEDLYKLASSFFNTT